MDDQDAVGGPPNVELHCVCTLRDGGLEGFGRIPWGVARCASVRDDEGQGGAVGHPDRMTVRDPPVRPAADREDLQ